MIRLNADVEEELAKKLRHRLADEGITFAAWLRRTILAYLEEGETKRKGRKGKEG